MTIRLVTAQLVLLASVLACAEPQNSEDDSPPEIDKVTEEKKPATPLIPSPNKPKKVGEVNAETKTGGRIITDPGMKTQVGWAMDDLAESLSVAKGDIELVHADYVKWPDSSLGCPEPGFQYMQVIVNGVMIRLVVNGKTYQYHGGGNRKPFLCENPSPKDPPSDELGEA